MREKTSKKTLSIRNSIVIYFLASMLITVMGIASMVFTNWMTSANKFTENVVKNMNYDITYQINNYLNIPEQINEYNYKLIASGIIDMEDEYKRNQFFVGIMENYKSNIYSFGYGLVTGEYYGVRKNKDGNLEVMKNNTETRGRTRYYSLNEDLTVGPLVMQSEKFDARTKDWYKAAAENRRPIFSPVYKHFIMNDLAVSAGYPIYNETGTLEGVLGTHIILSNIDTYLKEIVQPYQGVAIIFEEETGELIANSVDMENFNTLEDGSIDRISLYDLDNEAIKNTYEKHADKPNFILKSEEGDIYVSVSEYRKESLNWVIVSAVPTNILMKEIYNTIGLTILGLCIAMVLYSMLYFLITKRLFKPIKTLLQTSQLLSSGDLTQRVKIVRNDEIGIISHSFNEMADKMYHLFHNLEVKVKERTAELELTNETLNKTKDELYLILDSTAEGIFGMDTEGNCTFCNDRCINLLGYKHQDELLGKKVHQLIHYSDRNGHEIPVEKCKTYQTILDGKKTYTADEVFWKADGTCIDVEYYSYPQYKNNQVIGAVVTFMDITERKKNEEQIRYLSCHDSLTGLMNRLYLEEQLRGNDMLDKLPISIIFGDLNGLKLVNDIFGHGAGDDLIKSAAQILKSVCRTQDIIARVGGDEFIVLLPNTDAKEAREVLERVKSALDNEGVNDIKCSMALGLDTKVNIYQDVEKVMANAESEMYKEKIYSKKRFASETVETILKTLQKRSPKELDHSNAVASLCGKLGKALGLPETQVKKLRDAGYIHDIGKVILQKDILIKEDLNEYERQQMHQHPVIGYRILNLFDDTLDLADGVYAHHERWDGLGYPKGLKGEEIPLISRIIALVEYYERKVAKGKGHNPGAVDLIINEIKEESGKAFDPILVEIFIKLIQEED